MFIRNAAESPQSMGRSFNLWPIRFRKCIQPIAANVKTCFRSVTLHGTTPRSESRTITLAINNRLPAYNDLSRLVAACSQSRCRFCRRTVVMCRSGTVRACCSDCRGNHCDRVACHGARPDDPSASSGNCGSNAIGVRPFAALMACARRTKPVVFHFDFMT